MSIELANELETRRQMLPIQPIQLSKKDCKKTKYRTQADALFALTKLKELSTRKVIPSRCYHCLRCKLWHLTSKPNLYDLIEENKLLKIELEKLKEQSQPIAEQLVKNTNQINQINQLKANIQKERIATKNIMLKCKALDNKIFQIKKLIDKII